MVKLCYLGLVGGVLAAVFAIFCNSDPATILAVGLVLASIETIVLVKVADGFTPVVLPVLVVNSVLLCSLFLWDRVSKDASFGIILTVPEVYLQQASVIGIVFSASYSVGALLAGPRRIRISIKQLENSLAEFGSSFRVPSGILVGVGYAGIVLMVYAYGGALLQGRYLETRGPHWAAVLSNAAAPFAMLALSMVTARPSRWRVLAAVGLGLWLLILFGRATRSMAALPILVLLGRASAAGRRVRTRSIIFVGGVTFVLFQFAIIGRSNPEGVGILPLGTKLFTRGPCRGAPGGATAC